MKELQKDYSQARAYYERALAIRERTLGKNHPETATTLNNLGIVSYYQGELTEATKLLRRALTINEQLLGPDHPHCIKSKQSLKRIENELRRRKILQELWAQLKRFIRH